MGTGTGAGHGTAEHAEHADGCPGRAWNHGTRIFPDRTGPMAFSLARSERERVGGEGGRGNSKLSASAIS